jgi:hypothetical protein
MQVTMAESTTSTSSSTTRTVPRRSARVIAKLLKSTPICNNIKCSSDDGARERKASATIDSSHSDAATQHGLYSGTTFPVTDDYLLLNIFSYVGDFQYLFIGSVNKSFEKAYATQFPNKSTSFNASTLERANLCLDSITKDNGETKDKRLRELWQSAARYGNIDVVNYLHQQLPHPQKSVTVKYLGLDASDETMDWKYDLCSEAARYGQMELLQWACNNNICVKKDDYRVCTFAIGSCHFDIFHWALVNGFAF